MTLPLFIQLLLNGLSLGMLYLLIVLGMDLIMRLTGIANFAHGQFYMLGAYAVYLTCVVLHLPYWLALILAGIMLFLLGTISYVSIFQWMQRRFKPGMNFTYLMLMSAMASLGLMMILSQGSNMAFGTAIKTVPSFFPQLLSIGSIIVPAEKLAIIIIGLALVFGLFLLLFKTKLGKSMRAVSLDAEVSALYGINSSRIHLMGFALGCALAGITGGLIAPVYAITSEMGNSVIFMAFMIMIVGGMLSYTGTILGAIIVGLILSFGFHFLGSITQLILFVASMVVLIFKPGGFLGKVLE